MTDTTTSRHALPTPKFSKPPVVETILGVHFVPMRRLKNAHFGIFWKQLKTTDWPHIDEAAPVSPTVERFGEGVPLELRNINLHLTTEAAPTRLRIRNSDDDRMIQIQNGVFRYNWLGHKEQNKYPQFGSVNRDFYSCYSRFADFARKENLGDIQPQQWEISYINHLEKGTVWKQPQDVASVFPNLLGSLPPLNSTGTPVESLGGQWCHLIGEQQGRLHINLKHARKADETEIFVFTLTARGPAHSDEEMHAGIELGHQTIVFAFKELTSPAAHQYWEVEE